MKRIVTTAIEKGSCMRPLIEEGDTLHIQLGNSKLYKVGEIVIFILDKRFYCHRIFKVVPGGYLTKGDNTAIVDSFTDNKKVLGILIGISKKTGYINLESKYIQFFSKLLYLYSFLLYIVPRLSVSLISRLFFWRRFLIMRLIQPQKQLRFKSNKSRNKLFVDEAV